MSFKLLIHDSNQDLPMKKVWAMSATEYVKQGIQEVERELAAQDAYLPKRVETPLSSNYRPELDFSRNLDGSQVNYYQGLIGVLRWIVELGRIDIIVPVSLLSRYMVSPHEGHLQQAYHIFAHLKQFNRSKHIFDDAEPTFADAYFHECDWTEYYPDASEPIPPNLPEPLGHAVTTTCYVDADHAGCNVTRRSQTGIILYVNKASIMWFSKRQNTVESATFGSEFIALKTAIDQIDALRYKLRMFGIPLAGPTKVFCDNDAVVKNATHSESTLHRKHTSIRDLGRGFFWLDTIRSIHIDSRLEIDTIFWYVESALPRFSIRYSIHCSARAKCYVRIHTSTYRPLYILHASF
jgi:hypothetical protein